MNKDKEWLIRELKKIPHESQDGYLKVKVIDVLPLIDQLDKSAKAVVPRFVADYIRFSKGERNSPRVSMDEAHVSKELNVWLAKTKNYMTYPNQEKFMRAWLDGCEIEKEPLYYVISPDNLTMLHKDNGVEVKSSHGYFLTQVTQADFKNMPNYQLTEKEIKDYDTRYWPFAVSVEDKK